MDHKISELEYECLLNFTERNIDWVNCLIYNFKNYDNIYKYFKKLFGYVFNMNDGYNKIFLEFQCIYSYYYPKKLNNIKRKTFKKSNDLEKIKVIMRNDNKLAHKVYKVYGSYDNVYAMITSKVILLTDNNIRNDKKKPRRKKSKK